MRSFRPPRGGTPDHAVGGRSLDPALLTGHHEDRRRALEWADVRAHGGRAEPKRWSLRARAGHNSHCGTTLSHGSRRLPAERRKGPAFAGPFVETSLESVALAADSVPGVARCVLDVVPSLLRNCLLYTSDAADDLLCVDLGGRR